MKPIRYGPFARAADWYQGWRDGRSGIPPRPRTRGHRVTTAHREVLIRRAQDAFDHEYLRMETLLFGAGQTMVGAEARKRGSLAMLRRAEAESAALGRELTPEELGRRRTGEKAADPRIVADRRKREQHKRRTGVLTMIRDIHREVTDAEVQLARAGREATVQREVAYARVRRIHEHTHRRLAAYRRRLVRSHPDGPWVNQVLGVLDPEIPQWALPEHDGPGHERAEVDYPPPPPRSVEVIMLVPVTVFGSKVPPSDVLVEGYDVSERHFRIERAGQGLRLRHLGHGRELYVDGRAVRSATLRPGDSFDFDRFRYRVSEDATHLLVTRLGPAGLIVHGLSDETGRLTRMSFVQRTGTVVAILGPSGAGKSSLFGALTRELSTEAGGSLYFAGLDLNRHAEQVRSMLGFVPQDDSLHTTLTVRRLLRYSDRLRSTGPRHKGDRERHIEEICSWLGLTKHLDSLVANLSGGQRKRVSIGLELLSDPTLLMLDEPTSGLDSHMDREVMKLLRRYAHAGERTVITVTHSNEHLNLADATLVVGSRGRPVYFGAPSGECEALQAASYADLMATLAKQPDEPGGEVATALAGAYQAGPEVAEAAREAGLAAREPDERANRIRRPHAAVVAARQVPVLIARQWALVLSHGQRKNRAERGFLDRLRTVMVAASPMLIAAVTAVLAALVTGPDGLGPAEPGAPRESGPMVLSLLTTLAVLSGQALTYSNVVSEFAIVRREYRTGMKPSALLLANWSVYAVLAVAQAAIVTVVFTRLKPGPVHGLSIPPTWQLFVTLALLSVTAMSLGLLISVHARKLEQAVAWTTAASIAQIAFNGVTSDMSGDRLLQVLGMLMPTRWGLGAAASATDLRAVAPTTAYHDAIWSHTTGQYAFNMSMLAVLTLLFFVLAVVRLGRRLRPRQRISRRWWTGWRRSP
ncbi:ABC-type multidrug transport system ATPase subunit [Micromonospora echinospora]|uniref:ABC-type multidrug transport system ATPase subunit n=1 Tax=Micromonospora echinospora TaxID=1877 RepID=A0ABR6MAX7_MICEC|nr:ATP-binding cassette domain-containing protein [Micromonospora echinospora]MBB5112528.1 ABC-type multidrug transport system ATPase subunit [Micromonospora echinospora]